MDGVKDIWLPPPDLSISDWSDEFRRIPPEASAEPGIWRTSRAPYQRAIMDAISNERVERVVLMTAAQVGKTEILLNTIGYYIDKEPSPILLINPTLEMGKDKFARIDLTAGNPLEPPGPQRRDETSPNVMV